MMHNVEDDQTYLLCQTFKSLFLSIHLPRFCFPNVHHVLPVTLVKFQCINHNIFDQGKSLVRLLNIIITWIWPPPCTSGK